MFRSRLFPILLLTAVFAATARAGDTFVEPGDIDIKLILSPPPAKDSDQTHHEIDQLLQLQATRTDADIARIKTEVKMTPFIFSEVLGSWFNPDDLPTTAKFLIKVMKNANAINTQAKDFFKRERPFNVDPRIQPC